MSGNTCINGYCGNGVDGVEGEMAFRREAKQDVCRIGTYVRHKYYGVGKIVSIDDLGWPTVELLYKGDRITFYDNSQLEPTSTPPAFLHLY